MTKFPGDEHKCSGNDQTCSRRTRLVLLSDSLDINAFDGVTESPSGPISGCIRAKPNDHQAIDRMMHVPPGHSVTNRPPASRCRKRFNPPGA